MGSDIDIDITLRDLARISASTGEQVRPLEELAEQMRPMIEAARQVRIPPVFSAEAMAAMQQFGRAARGIPRFAAPPALLGLRMPPLLGRRQEPEPTPPAPPRTATERARDAMLAHAREAGFVTQIDARRIGEKHGLTTRTADQLLITLPEECRRRGGRPKKLSR